MQIIYLQRRGGKTKMLADQVKSELANGAALIVFSYQEKERIEGKFKEIKGRVFIIDEFQRGRLLGIDIRTVYIDNADLILENLFRRYEVKAISLSYPEE